MTEVFRLFAPVIVNFMAFFVALAILISVVKEIIRFYFREKEAYVLRLSEHEAEERDQEFQIH